MYTSLPIMSCRSISPAIDTKTRKNDERQLCRAMSGIQIRRRAEDTRQAEGREIECKFIEGAMKIFTCVFLCILVTDASLSLSHERDSFIGIYCTN